MIACIPQYLTFNMSIHHHFHAELCEISKLAVLRHFLNKRMILDLTSNNLDKYSSNPNFTGMGDTNGPQEAHGCMTQWVPLGSCIVLLYACLTLSGTCQVHSASMACRAAICASCRQLYYSIHSRIPFTPIGTPQYQYANIQRPMY